MCMCVCVCVCVCLGLCVCVCIRPYLEAARALQRVHEHLIHICEAIYIYICIGNIEIEI